MANFGRDRRGGGGGRDFGRRDFGGNRGGRGGFGGGFDRGGERREMFSAVCSNCGKDCQVPFRPSNGKPVYCSDCFEKMNGGRDDSRRPERDNFRSPAPAFDQNKAQFDAMNAKLDKILNILAPTTTPVVVGKKIEPVSVKDSVEAKEIKPEKAKKVIKKAASKKKE